MCAVDGIPSPRVCNHFSKLSTNFLRCDTGDTPHLFPCLRYCCWLFGLSNVSLSRIKPPCCFCLFSCGVGSSLLSQEQQQLLRKQDKVKRKEVISQKLHPAYAVSLRLTFLCVVRAACSTFLSRPCGAFCAPSFLAMVDFTAPVLNSGPTAAVLWIITSRWGHFA